jgi:hypothetical protein
MLEFLERFEP